MYVRNPACVRRDESISRYTFYWTRTTFRFVNYFASINGLDAVISRIAIKRTRPREYCSWLSILCKFQTYTRRIQRRPLIAYRVKNHK